MKSQQKLSKKKNYDIFGNFITENFNYMTEYSVFPESLKQAGI